MFKIFGTYICWINTQNATLEVSSALRELQLTLGVYFRECCERRDKNQNLLSCYRHFRSGTAAEIFLRAIGRGPWALWLAVLPPGAGKSHVTPRDVTATAPLWPNDWSMQQSTREANSSSCNQEINLYFMEGKGSLPCSQNPAMSAYLDPQECRIHPPIIHVEDPF